MAASYRFAGVRSHVLSMAPNTLQKNRDMTKYMQVMTK
jgi:hypothetical protein